MTAHKPAHEVELYREGDAYVVIVDLPGFERDSIGARWHDGRLHVHAERHGDGDSRSKVVNRHVSVPHEVDEDRIRAEYDDGVLEVTLPIVQGSEGPGTEIDIQ